MSVESKTREAIAAYGASLFERGLTFGSSGNISVRVDDGWLMTPTGVSLGRLDPASISKLDETENHISGDKPTKETFLHLAMYRRNAAAAAIVHLHSTYSVAVSCLRDIDPADVLPPLTAYYVMRIGKLPLIPYYPPGDPALGDAVSAYADQHHAVLLANHGPVVAGPSLDHAANAVEELEETAKLHLLLRNALTRPLTDAQVKDIRKRYPTL